TYGNVDEAVKGARMVLEKARPVLEQKKWIRALDLTICVIQEMMGLLENADDSDGTIGDVVHTGFEVIRELVEDESLMPGEKEPLFQKLMQEACSKRYDGWTDWRVELLESCSFLAVTPEMRNKLEQLLNSMLQNKQDDHSWEMRYFDEQVNL